MVCAAAQLETSAEVYEDVKWFILDCIRKFQRRNGGDYEELAGQAHLIYMRAYNTYDSGKGKFTTWLGFLLYKILMEHKRRAAMRNARLHRTGVDPESLALTKSNFNLVDFLDSLSEDGKVVASMVLETPMDLRLALVGTGTSYKTALREVLSDLGWTSKRILETFNEIRDALK